MSESSMRKQSPMSVVVSEATNKQRMASDPLVSSWVGASAGSGKTKVLTDRILRLLLPRESGAPGTRPEKILALTFTKAGANEMALRLSRRLSEWAVMDDSKLAQDMEQNLFGRPPTAQELTEARKLFARVVDTPGGLNIMTIHSFCQSVLGRFPIEAGLPPHFKPLEEEQARELLEKAKRDILSHAGTNTGSPIARAIANISTSMNEEQFSDALRALIGERHQMQMVLRRTFGIDGLYTNLCTLFGVTPGRAESDLFAAFCTSKEFNEINLREACAPLANGSASDQEKAGYIQDFLDADPAAKAAFYTSYKKAFVTKENTPLKTAATKGVLQNAPHILSVLTNEAERIIRFENERKAIACVTLTRDLFILGEAVLARYQSFKESMGVLDFDDLILKTLSLLKGETISPSGQGVTAWVMYKLDEGLDHILIDEAQDTNPEQWDIIRLLADDFFEGAGAKDYVRTLFVVGDEKQSIFSFQRAAPEKFGQMRGWFEKKIRTSGERFVPVDINTSFRSVQIVLDAVDSVFTGNPRVLGLSDDYLNHIAKREGQAGLVEFWPLYRTVGDDENEANEEDIQPSLGGWFMPDKLVESQSGSAQMAAKIGDMIKNWRDTKEPLESYGRPIQPGDIMILVRSRNAFVGQLVRALKKNKVPVSGVDRMLLADQIVVQDLCAAAAFALLPDDDLTLAALLKSPFLSVDETALFNLAHKRQSTLWNALREKGDSDVVSWLEALIVRAGSDHPYEFFSRIVQEPCPGDSRSGLHAIRTRLGDDAMDPLDEFLNTALSFEGMHTASLQGFLKWHEDISSEIKREMEEGGSAVRIMTVHGAKGLQAPIIFLPDTVRTASSAKGERIFWPHKTGLDLPFYVPSKDSAPEIAQAAQTTLDQKADEEYRRLLYVAMTRAEERLYIGGYLGKKAPGKDSKTAYWYDDIRAAFGRLPGLERLPSGVADEDGNDQSILRLSSKRTAEPDKTGKTAAAKDSKPVTLPPWVFQKAPEEPFPPKPLVPSRPSGMEPAAASPRAAGNEHRFKRGTATHKLMQILPELPPARRQSAAEQFLARSALGLPPQLQKDIAREVMAILNDENFKDIFGAGSMAEVPVTGLIDKQTLISGQIDRVLIRKDDILIVDYKTNRPPPMHEEDVSPVYIRQMRAYADALRKIYPKKKVRAALLWTDGARLMEITV